MFEELAVWKRVDPTLAIRYVGFRDVEENRVWIAFANWVGLDEARDIAADELIAPQATLEAFLNAPPADPALWKATVAEAVALFVENHPDT